MRYFHEIGQSEEKHGLVYHCRHPLFDLCTLYFQDGRGLGVVRQRFDPVSKTLSWGPLEPGLANDIFEAPGFADYFDAHAAAADSDGYFPTVGVRKLMWAIRMKPLRREDWEQKLQGL